MIFSTLFVAISDSDGGLLGIYVKRDVRRMLGTVDNRKDAAIFRKMFSLNPEEIGVKYWAVSSGFSPPQED